MKITSLFLSGVLLFLALNLYGCKSKETNQVFSSDGVAISYTQQGQGEPALVFVHGWSCDQTFWKYQVPYFAKNHKVVAIDLGGHGQSGLGRKEWTIEAYGKDVAAVVKKLGLRKVILVGHSMGGPVIAEVARQVPKKVIALVGADTFHNIEQGYTGEQMAQIIANMQRDFKKESDIFVRQMFPPNADANLVDWVAAKISSAHPEVAVSTLRGLGQYNLLQPLQDSNVPVYSISADFWPTEFETNKKYIESFEIKLMPGIGHFVMLEDPDKFNQLLTEILNELGR
jgi:pimeloyl-ACP methyl ester carboxylesterase